MVIQMYAITIGACTRATRARFVMHNLKNTNTLGGWEGTVPLLNYHLRSGRGGNFGCDVATFKFELDRA